MYVTAEPLFEGLADAIEKGDISARMEPKIRARKLADNFGYDLNEAKKIWCFGPETTGANVLID